MFSREPIHQTITETKASYPNIPDFQMLPSLEAEWVPFNFDWPRRPDKTIDSGSNLFLGLTEDQYKAYEKNMTLVISRETQWRSIVDSMNVLLKGWREKNASNADNSAGPQAKTN